MSSKEQSSRQSQRSSSPASSVQSDVPPEALIVSKVPVAEKESDIHGDLTLNYDSIEKVFRLYNNNNEALNQIQIEFGSDEVMLKILAEKTILIGNKRYPVWGYWPVHCRRCKQKGHKVSQCPLKLSTQWRLIELINEQNTNFTSQVNEFQRKWNTRLLKLQTASSNTAANQLFPVVKDLTAVCQQFSQQNVQMQNQFAAVVNRAQAMELKVNS